MRSIGEVSSLFLIVKCPLLSEGEKKKIGKKKKEEDISVSLSSPYVPKIYLHCWSLLKDYPNHPNACLISIRPVRGG